MPLSESEGGIVTDAGTLQRVYTRIAGLIGSAVPDVNFEKFAEDFVRVQQQLAGLMAHERAATEHAAHPITDVEPESSVRASFV